MHVHMDLQKLVIMAPYMGKTRILRMFPCHDENGRTALTAPPLPLAASAGSRAGWHWLELIFVVAGGHPQP